jgi:hypothetical protein
VGDACVEGAARAIEHLQRGTLGQPQHVEEVVAAIAREDHLGGRVLGDWDEEADHAGFLQERSTAGCHPSSAGSPGPGQYLLPPTGYAKALPSMASLRMAGEPRFH